MLHLGLVPRPPGTAQCCTRAAQRQLVQGTSPRGLPPGRPILWCVLRTIATRAKRWAASPGGPLMYVLTPRETVPLRRGNPPTRRGSPPGDGGMPDTVRIDRLRALS